MDYKSKRTHSRHVNSMMVARLAFIGLLLSSSPALGDNIITVPVNFPHFQSFCSGGCRLFAAGWKQDWTFKNVSITSQLIDQSGSPGVEGVVYLVNKLGAGATPANNVAPPLLVSGLPRNTFSYRVLFSGLTLPPGNYYIVWVPTGTSPQTMSPRYTMGSTGSLTAPGVIDLGSGVNSNPSAEAFPPASPVGFGWPGLIGYTVSGDPVVGDTVTRLYQSAATTQLGEPFTLTATVSSREGAPTGAVSFIDGSLILGTSNLEYFNSYNGITYWRATLTVSALSGGTHGLVVEYPGAGIFFASRSDVLSHNVLRDPTATAIASQLPNTVYGQEVLFTVTVQPVPANASLPFVPSGLVTIRSDAAAIGTATVTNGVATFTASRLPAGTHAITATYGGDVNFEASNSNTIQQNVAKALSSITLHSFSNPAAAGSRILLDVTVSAVGQPAVLAEGSVTLSEDNRVLATGALAFGHTTVSSNSLPTGVHHLVLVFAGDSNFEPSRAAFDQTVLPPALSIASTRTAEGNDGSHVVPLLIQLSAPSQQTVSVRFTTVDDSALAGRDYEGMSGTAVFEPGEVAQTVELRVFGDTTPEEDQTFSVMLSDPVKAPIAVGVATVVIVDDDPFYTVAFDYEYAEVDGASLTLDLYTPTAGVGPYPLIIWVPGDVTYDGARCRATPAINDARRGYAVAVVTYRGPNTAVFPAQISDVNAAIRWLRANATRFRLDPLRFGIWGVGAGAHLASLVGLASDNPSFTNLTEGNPAASSRVQAVVDWAGPADLLELQSIASSCGTTNYNSPDSPVSQLIGCPPMVCEGKWRTASPTQYVTADDPPFLIMHGDSDCVFPVDQSQRLYAALKNARVVADFDLYAGMGHDASFWYSKEMMDEVDLFFDKYLKPRMRERSTDH